MQTSGRLLNFIGGHEGFVGKWYLDAAHVPTIGYGFTWASKVFVNWWMAKYGRKMKRGDTISKADALQVLKLMIEGEYGPPVERKMPTAQVNVKEASTSAVFNLGTGALAWKWAAAFAHGDIKDGAAKLRITGTTINKGKKKLPGLVRRRGEEADIAEHNRWPSWLSGTVMTTTPPETHMTEEDIREAQSILKSLGYYQGDVDGLAGNYTRVAVTKFQKDHGTLKVDGILGKATLTALVRTRDARSAGKKVTVGTGASAGTGAAANANNVGDGVTVPVPETPVSLGIGIDLGIIGDLLLWGGLLVFVCGIGYLAYRYRDELLAIVRRL